MTPFLAIAKLTCRATMRSYVFHFLFLLLLAVIFILPNTIISDGTAKGLIYVSLKYCLGVSGFLLSLSTIWVSCFTLSNDLETYQMHMICVKPVSRVVIWLGKLTGVVFLHGVLLLLSSIIIYIFTIWQFERSTFSDEEKEKIKNEVLVGRRVYMPEMPDFSKEVEEQITKLNLAIKEGKPGAPDKQLSLAEKRKLIKEIRNQIIAKYGEIPFGNFREWKYKALDPLQKSPLSFRYRIYVGKVSSKDQRQTLGIFGAYVPFYENEEDAKKGKEPKYELIPKTSEPESFMCGVFLEDKISPVIIRKDGTARIAFQNLDPEKASLFFQPNDGPKLLEPKVSFFQNYLRAAFVIFLRIILLAGLGASAGGLFSMPVAVFIVISYLIFGISASFVIDIERDFGYDEEALRASESLWETAARQTSHGILAVIIPMQKFEVSDTVADGELIEFSFIAKFFTEIFLIRGLPLFVVAVYLYKRREIGLIVKK